ncbi:MAG: PH domain-containing protein [Thermoanaerobaculia bacterium]|nr:PH domain-containing protein [Thermoanaerobaculia bacterium]
MESDRTTSALPDAGSPIVPDDGFHRTPTISILFLLLDGLRSTIPALLAFAVVSGGSRFAIAITLVFLLFVLLGSSLLRWISFAYRFDAEEMVLRTGILSRNERHVPYHRFQNIDLEQNPLHRFLKVAKVRLETASGGKPEAVISVLRLPDIEEMRARVFAPRGTKDPSDTESTSNVIERSRDAHATEEQEIEILHHGVGDLTLLGLISNRGLLVVAAAFGLIEQFVGFDNSEFWERWLGGAGDWIGRIDFQHMDYRLTALYATLLLVVFLAATRVLSIAWMLFTLWGFRLIRRGGDLRTAYGLITRITATIPRHRIQLLSWHESVLHQWTGTASLKVETAGGGAAGGDESSSQQMPGNAARLWLAPLARVAGLAVLFRQVTPDLGPNQQGPGEPGQLPWSPVSPRAWARLVRRNSLLLLLLSILSAIGLELSQFSIAYAALPLLLLPLVWIWSRRWTKRSGYVLTDRFIGFRSGAFGRRTSFVPLGKIQVVQFSQGFFDRRAVMARVKVDTAGANLSSHRVVIPYLDLEDARRLAGDLERHASETMFHW